LLINQGQSFPKNIGCLQAQLGCKHKKMVDDDGGQVSISDLVCIQMMVNVPMMS
jgi:hypothetical protein